MGMWPSAFAFALVHLAAGPSRMDYGLYPDRDFAAPRRCDGLGVAPSRQAGHPFFPTEPSSLTQPYDFVAAHAVSSPKNTKTYAFQSGES